ncbi:MAG: hypothetical protein C4583_06155 [Anaerolineaceae bacterium]|nr:MAG: hypothetical protein C4583_06155 [Anaerolineaceae bacterium]
MIVLVLMVALTACAPKSTPAPVAGEKFDVNDFVGTYEGTWDNESTGASGPVVISIEADESTHNVTLTLDFGGKYLGLADPPAVTLSATYNDNGATVVGNSVLFGDMDVRIDANGNIIGNFKNLAGGTIPAMMYTGKIGDGRLDADYVITLPDGTTATALLRTQRK